MKRKICITLLSITLIASMGLSVYWINNIRSQRQQYEQLNTIIADLESQLASMSSEITHYQTFLSSLEEEESKLSNDVAMYDEDIEKQNSLLLYRQKIKETKQQQLEEFRLVIAELESQLN